MIEIHEYDDHTLMYGLCHKMWKTNLKLCIVVGKIGQTILLFTFFLVMFCTFFGWRNQTLLKLQIN